MRYAWSLVVLSAAGCASPGASSSVGDAKTQSTVRVNQGGSTAAALTVTNQPTTVTVVVPTLPARVWRELPAAYDSLGIPVTKLINEDMLIGNQNFKVRRSLAGVRLPKYLECGGPASAPNAETYQVTMSILTQLQKREDGGTLVSTLIDASAQSVNFNNSSVACRSNGDLEKLVAKIVQARLNQ
ncbi:MAG: hypothetical protein ABJD07_04550 [Gemmatimonadaceae bacterium]